jgi:hypothetical protein
MGHEVIQSATAAVPAVSFSVPDRPVLGLSGTTLH